MTAVSRGPAAAPRIPADPPAVRGLLRVLGLTSLVLGLASAVIAFVTPMRPAAATGVLAAIAVVAVVLGALVQDGARRTRHRTSGPATSTMNDAKAACAASELSRSDAASARARSISLTS